MMTMCFNIAIGQRQLLAVESISIVRSVSNLADTAQIALPAMAANATLDIESKIAVGDTVEIQLGYDNKLETEFSGYIDRINTDDGNLTIECIDALWFFKRVSLPDKVFNDVSLNDLLQQIVAAVEIPIDVKCDYSLTYKKFTFYKATAFDVLKKIQDDTKADIYFENTTLHIHPVYSEAGNRVAFDFSKNIESAELKYIKAGDRDQEVEVSYTDIAGTVHTATMGKSGGKKTKIAVPADDSGIQKVAENWYNALVYDGYEGSFTGWLVPYVKPTDIVSLHDEQYEYKDGDYYVVGTEVEFSSSGGRRKIELGRRMSQ